VRVVASKERQKKKRVVEGNPFVGVIGGAKKRLKKGRVWDGQTGPQKPATRKLRISICNDFQRKKTNSGGFARRPGTDCKKKSERNRRGRGATKENS